MNLPRHLSFSKTHLLERLEGLDTKHYLRVLAHQFVDSIAASADIIMAHSMLLQRINSIISYTKCVDQYDGILNTACVRTVYFLE